MRELARELELELEPRVVGAAGRNGQLAFAYDEGLDAGQVLEHVRETLQTAGYLHVSDGAAAFAPRSGGI